MRKDNVFLLKSAPADAFFKWQAKSNGGSSWVFYWFTLHPTLKSSGMPMYKGFKKSVGSRRPYTHLYLTLHSDVITTVKHDTESN